MKHGKQEKVESRCSNILLKINRNFKGKD